jgi:hypothetical protein
MRETTSADSTAEVLTWRIDTIVKTTPRKLTETNLYQPRTALPPWMPPRHRQPTRHRSPATWLKPQP